MSRYFYQESVPVDLAQREPGFLEKIERDLQERLVRRFLLCGVKPNEPWAVEFRIKRSMNTLRPVKFYEMPVVEIYVEMECTPIPRMGVTFYPQPEFEPIVRRDPSKSKLKPFMQRVKSWWKEMQQPMPYDGGYGEPA